MKLIFSSRLPAFAIVRFLVIYFCLVTTVKAEILISDAWSLPLPPSSVNGAAYLTVINRGPEDDQLLGAHSDIATRAELHNHVMQDGLMGMVRLDGIDLPSDSSVMLKPGGLHVMLLNLAQPLVPGLVYTLTLRFKRAGEVTTKVTVRDP